MRQIKKIQKTCYDCVLSNAFFKYHINFDKCKDSFLGVLVTIINANTGNLTQCTTIPLCRFMRSFDGVKKGTYFNMSPPNVAAENSKS